MAESKKESKTSPDEINSALSNKDFLNFLSKAPDQNAINLSDPETTKKMWDSFRLKTVVYANLKVIYSTRVKEELGLELTDQDLGSMDEFLTKEAFSAPDKLLRLGQKIKALDELPKRIELRVKFIETLGLESRFKDMEKLLSSVDENNKNSGFLKNLEWTKLEPLEPELAKDLGSRLIKYLGDGFQRGKDIARNSFTMIRGLVRGGQPENEKVLKERYEIPPDQAGEALDLVRKSLAQIDKAKKGKNEMEEDLQILKDMIFDESLLPASLVAEAAQKKIGEEFKKLISESNKPTAPVEKILELRNKVDRVLSSKENYSFDYTKKMDTGKLVKIADQLLELKARITLGTAIENLTIEDKDNPLAKLEEEVAPFIGDNLDAKKFFTKELKNLIGKGTLDATKTVLLKMLLMKLDMGTTEEEKTPEESNAWVEKNRSRIKNAFG